MTCPSCGTDQTNHTIPVWQNPDDHDSGKQPDFIGCTNCHQMHRPDLLRGEDDVIPPQAQLSDHEISRVPIGNQHTDRLSIIEWQVVKGAAAYYGVRDWTAKADSMLTAEENVSLMEKHGTRNPETGLRHSPSPGEYRGESDD